MTITYAVGLHSRGKDLNLKGIEFTDAFSQLKLTKKERRVLDLYREGNSEAHIAKILNISRQAVNKTIKRIKKKMVDFGVDRLTKLPSVARIGNNKSIQQFLHRMYREYEIISKPDNIEDSKPINLKNNNIQKILHEFGITQRIINNKLILEGLRLYSELDKTAPELLKAGESLYDTIAIMVEQKTAIELKRDPNNDLLGITTGYEIELQNYPLAELIEEKSKVDLCFNKITGKSEFWKDRSGGRYNIESNNVEIFEIIRDFSVRLIKREWSIEEQVKFNNENTLKEQQLEKQIEQLSLEIVKLKEYYKVREEKRDKEQNMLWEVAGSAWLGGG